MSFFVWLRNLKDGAPNYAARAGEPIKGNLGRAADGKFSAVGSGGGSAKPAAKPKPTKSPGNQKKVMQATRAGGIGPKSFAVMNAIRDGKKPDAKTLAVLAKSGLVTADGKLTPAGLKFMAASDKGDAKGALAAVRAAKPGAAKPAAPKGAKPKPVAKPPQAKPVKKPLAAKPKPTKPVAAKPKPAVKPTAKPPTKPTAAKPKPVAAPVKKPAPVVAKPVKPAKVADPAKAAERQAATEDRKKRQADADARRADADKRRAIADERRAARDAERAKPKPEKPAKEPAKGGGGGGGGGKSDNMTPEDIRARNLTGKLSRGESLAPDEEDELIRNGFAKRGKDGGLILTSSGQSKRKEAPNLTVFKDASGRYRWVLRTTTAFRDRDQEIISTKAIEQDCDRADADGDYGPLRWWHIPGLDIGDCDFNMLYGRTLIESGTFRDERLGPIIAAKSADLESSPGFLHPPTEPVEGVYHTTFPHSSNVARSGY